jgi:hypothetical protein
MVALLILFPRLLFGLSPVTTVMPLLYLIHRKRSY